MDVLTAAWTGAGRPGMATGVGAGHCARCGRPDAGLVPVRAAVSKVFTGFDGWRDPSWPRLCAACAWAYRTPVLRGAAHVVSAAPAGLRLLSPAELGEVLDRSLPAGLAVVVPLRPGRKHLLPLAEWGRVTVDDAALPWTGSDASRLAVLRRLRSAGFGPRMLFEGAPPWPVLRRLPPAEWPQILTDWAVLDPWRARRLWFDLALRASVPTNAGAA